MVSRWPLWSAIPAVFLYEQTTLLTCEGCVKMQTKKDSFPVFFHSDEKLGYGEHMQRKLRSGIRGCRYFPSVQNLKVDGKAVSDKDPWQNSFMPGNGRKNNTRYGYLSGSGPSGKI